MWTQNSDLRDNRGLLATVLLGMVMFAWLLLTLWSVSPYARYLDHAALAHLPMSQSNSYLYLLFLFVAGWMLMLVAMMLPTSLPLITLFFSIVRRHAKRKGLVTLLIAGYLAVWLAFGIVAHLGDWLLHVAVAQNLWLALHAWSISAVIFLVAGVYQFSPLKYYCLEKCRSPLSFILGYWHGRHPRRDALTLGMRHGLFCLGCCWSLMLLMFGVGMGNLGWMLLLGAIMALEKNLPWGQHLSKPLGVILSAWAVVLVISNLLV